MPEQLAQTIVMKVAMHCEGCSRKVRKTLYQMAGVEHVNVDFGEQKVIMKGALDPKKVLEKLQKAGKAVEILEVIELEPPKPAEEASPAEPPKEDPPPQVRTICLKVPMHCEGCARKVKYVLQKIQGVQNVEVDFKQQKVIVIGMMDANTVIQKASKTGKNIELWPTPPEEVKEEPKESSSEEKKDPPPEENKDDAKKEEKDASVEDKKEENKDAPQESFTTEEPKKEEAKEEAKETPKEETAKEADGTKEEKIDASEENKKTSIEEKKDEIKSFNEEFTSPYIVYRCDAPQIFSDENPNACTLM